MHSSALQCNYALCICNLIHRRGRTLCVQAAWLPLALPCCARMHAAPLCQITSGFQVAACAQARCPGPRWRAPCARQRARWRRRCSARSARRAATWSWTPSSWSDRAGSRRRGPDRWRPCSPTLTRCPPTCACWVAAYTSLPRKMVCPITALVHELLTCGGSRPGRRRRARCSRCAGRPPRWAAWPAHTSAARSWRPGARAACLA